MTYISSLDIDALYKAIACCFPSTMIAYEKEQLKHFETIY